ncbi:MAG TPA: hypothetical protein VGD62_10650 [Acidobacteriaceae bacterium]
MAFPQNHSSRQTRTLARGAARLFLTTTALCALAVLPLRAQQPTYSTSSNAGLTGGEDIDGRSLASPPAPAAAAPQYGGGYGGYNGYHESRFSHIAIEAGGGFTAPVGNAASGGFTGLVGNGQKYPSITWGGNIIAGAGWNFSKRFSTLAEYSFNSNKIPGRTLSAIALSDGTNPPGGNVHTWALTLEPMFYYANSPKHKYGGYVIGGGGFYRKVTSFTEPVQYCEYTYYGEICGYVNAVAAHFSANAGGVNLGTGMTYKLFGPDSSAKLFAEARYVFVDTPRFTGGNPETGTEELIPVTVGLRF